MRRKNREMHMRWIYEEPGKSTIEITSQIAFFTGHQEKL